MLPGVATATEINERNGRSFLEPEEIIAPRVFRLGLKYRF